MQNRKLSHKGNVKALQGENILVTLLDSVKDAFEVSSPYVQVLVYHPLLEVVWRGACELKCAVFDFASTPSLVTIRQNQLFATSLTFS